MVVLALSAAMTTSGLGLALIYAGLDQGNRLDWLNSGLIWGLMLAGGVLLVGSIWACSMTSVVIPSVMMRTAWQNFIKPPIGPKE